MTHLTRRPFPPGLGSAALLLASACLAGEPATVQRVDAGTVTLHRLATDPVDVWLSGKPSLDPQATLLQSGFTGSELKAALPEDRRLYLVLAHRDGRRTVVAERLLPLQQGSNFRDLGGYQAADGRTVRWGRLFRSAGMPLLTDRDYALLAQLGIDSVVDLRSLPERELAPDQLDDRSGALFLSNDYPLRDLMSHMGKPDGDDMYAGLEQLLVPQFRMAVKRMLAGQGAVVFHDVWGQDRAGVFAALIYDVLGVDRSTIIADFHLSTSLRRTRYEIPKLSPADYPGNPIVAYYASKASGGEYKPEQLYTRGGVSHIDQFLRYIDRRYGSSAGYFDSALGIDAQQLQALKSMLLE